MKTPELDYIADLVAAHPGEYSPPEVIRQLRLHIMETGSDDPGLAQARDSLEDAFRTGIVCVRVEQTHLDIRAKERCYLRS